MALMTKPTKPVRVTDLPHHGRRLRPLQFAAFMRARVVALLHWPFGLRKSRPSAAPRALPPFDSVPRRDGTDVISLIALGRSRMPPRPPHHPDKEIQR